MDTVKHHIEEEALIVRNSGEIPEVAYHGSLYYLTEDPEGPRLSLGNNELALLKEMVVERYCEIIRRDLAPENRKKTIYRGLARCYANWNRLKHFCEREQLEINGIRREMADLLVFFLKNEAADCRSPQVHSCINLAEQQLVSFIDDLGITKGDIPNNLPELCPEVS